MQTGDAVRVHNMNGEKADGEIVAILASRASEHPIDFIDVDGVTLADYWRGILDDPDCWVVQVRLGERIYDYPAERVEVIDG